ncbi:MAG: hypothetical protein MJ211_04170 [Bacteroidales bacterium]|nr:hypothetical protein [Bacteroidales bacterium]
MKKIFGFLMFVCVLTSCGPTRQEAADYNDRVIELQRLVITKYDALLETYDTYVASKMDDALIEFEEQIDLSEKAVKAIPIIESAEYYTAEILNYFEVYKSIAENESRELVRLYKVPENEFSSEMRVQWDALYKQSDDKAKAADKKLQEVQTKFAEQFNLVLNKKSL